MELRQGGDLRQIERTPAGDTSLKSAQLIVLILTWLLLLEPFEQRFRLQLRRIAQHLLDLRPILGKGIRPRSVGSRFLHLAGQQSQPLILSSRFAAL